MNADGVRARCWIVLIAAWALGMSGVAGAAAVKGPMKLTSQAFEEGQAIPPKHTCDAENVSPVLTWSGVPPGTGVSVKLVIGLPVTFETMP